MEANKLLNNGLSIDKIIYEQQLGINWTRPFGELLTKCELPSYIKGLQFVNENQQIQNGIK